MSLKEKFAYVSYGDGTIEQYCIGADGGFRPLAPTSVRVGKFPSRVVSGPSGEHAYIASEDGIQQFSINQDGTLSSPDLLSIAPRPENLLVDRTGHYAYATVNIDRGYVLQYRVSDNGRLSPLSPPSVRAGGCPSALAFHPSRQFLYVSSRWDGTVSQYRIESDGNLVPLSPPRVSVGQQGGDIAFSHSGKYGYVTDERAERIVMLRVNENGTLTPVSSCGYSSDFVMCCGVTKIAVDPDDRTLFVTNNAGAVYEINVTRDPGPSLRLAEHYLLTNDNKMRSLKETRESAKDEIARKRAGKDDVDALNTEIAVVNADLKRPFYATYDSGGTLHLISHAGVLRRKVKPDGKMESLAPAFAWPDKAKAVKSEKDPIATVEAAESPMIDGLTILER